MRTREPKPNYSEDDRAAAAWQINLDSMNQALRQIVETHFRVMERRGELSLVSAFKVINQVEGSPEIRAWNSDREQQGQEYQALKNRKPASGRDIHDSNDWLMNLQTK